MRRRDVLKAGALALPGTGTLGAQARHAGNGGRGSRPLKITKVEAFVLRGPNDGKPLDSLTQMPPVGHMTGGVGLWNRLDHHSPSRTPGGSQATLVKITTDQGISGWGESHAPLAPRVHKVVIQDLLAPVLLGQDARNVEALWEKMYSTQRLRGYATGFYTESIAGADLALWDILGKYLNAPVYQLLGGKFRDRIPTYASAGDPERARQLVAEGFQAVKMGLSKGSEKDLDKVAAVADAIKGKGQLFVDSLGAYKLYEAIQVGRELDRLGNIGWWEDALAPEDISGYGKLADALDVAICAGEEMSNRYQFRELFQAHSVDIVNPDVCRAAGITECKRIAILADTYGVLWSPHVSTGTSVYRSASIQLAAATPNAVIIEGGNTHAGPLGDRLLKQPLEYAPGYAVVSDRPGLGIEFDEKELAKVIVA